MEIKTFEILPRLKGRNQSSEYKIAQNIFESFEVNQYTDIETEYPKTISMALIRMSKSTIKKFTVGRLDKKLYRVCRII